MNCLTGEVLEELLGLGGYAVKCVNGGGQPKKKCFSKGKKTVLSIGLVRIRG